MQTSLASIGFSFLAAATLLMPARAAGPAREADDKLLAEIEPRLKAVYETDEFRMRGFSATWLPDSSGYLKLETPDGSPGPEIARYGPASGKRTVVAGEKLVVPGKSERLKIHGFVCSPTGKRLLLHTDEAGGADCWVYETESGDLHPVKAGNGVGFDANAFSPDEGRLLGSRSAELVVFDLASGRITQVTEDSDSYAIANSGATWSPDGKWIAYVRSDYFVYPNRDHGLSEGKGTGLHVQMLIVRYLLDHLPAGPR
jgi:Tol biopolymer transport system component